MPRPTDPSRRAFLTGRLEDPATQPRLGPAPPWLAGLISTGSCRSCGQPCVDACPENIIRTHPATHSCGGLAYLDFQSGACTFCRACVDVCPEAVGGIAGDRPLPPVSVDDARCLAAQGVVCVICVARCPERALSGRPGGRISVAADTCTGCGDCVAACPTAALEIPGNA